VLSGIDTIVKEEVGLLLRRADTDRGAAAKDASVVLVEDGASASSSTTPSSASASDDAGALVERIKARAIADTRTLTGKDQYEVGDISRAVASSLRRELSARLSSGEWDLEDLSLLLRTVLLLGAKVSPAARLLPVQALIQAYSAQLASELGERTVAEVVNRLQSKLYEGASSAVGSYTGKEKYELGDITKKAVADLTGKDVGQYQFGDITRTIAGKFFGGDEKDAGDDKTRKPNS